MSSFLKSRRRRSRIRQGLNITPLIDINANLLFFMMINASVQEDRLEAGKAVELPESTARTAEAGDLISIVVGLEHISINEIEIMKMERGTFPEKDFDAAQRRVRPLYDELTARFQDLVKAGAQPGKKGADGDDGLPVILIQADKRLPYTIVSQVMRTCGQAGFTKFRFAASEVLSRGTPAP